MQPDQHESSSWQRIRVKAITRPTIGLKIFELVSADDRPLQPAQAGDHIEITPPEGPTRAYSLCGDPADTSRYFVAVLRDSHGRGGSKAMHDKVAIDSILDASGPRSGFPLEENARRYILIGGGIGITPLVAMAHRLSAIGADFQVHYTAPSMQKLIFREQLAALTETGHLHLYESRGDNAARFDPQYWLEDVKEDTLVYCCGPEKLMKAVRGATTCWPKGNVRFESFKATTPENAEAFEVELARSGVVIPVYETESILTALWRAGFPRPLSCETGICGTCRTPYLDGDPDHRDEMLTEDERRREMLICVSRCNSARLVLDI